MHLFIGPLVYICILVMLCSINKRIGTTWEFKAPEAIKKENNWVFKTTINAHKFIMHRKSILIFYAHEQMQNSFRRLNILEIIIMHSFSLCSRAVFKSENPQTKRKFSHTHSVTIWNIRKRHKKEENFRMVFISFAKSWIKFFNFSFLCKQKMEADMFENAQKPGWTLF